MEETKNTVNFPGAFKSKIDSILKLSTDLNSRISLMKEQFAKIMFPKGGYEKLSDEERQETMSKINSVLGPFILKIIKCNGHGMDEIYKEFEEIYLKYRVARKATVEQKKEIISSYMNDLANMDFNLLWQEMIKKFSENTMLIHREMMYSRMRTLLDEVATVEKLHEIINAVPEQLKTFERWSFEVKPIMLQYEYLIKAKLARIG